MSNCSNSLENINNVNVSNTIGVTISNNIGGTVNEIQSLLKHRNKFKNDNRNNILSSFMKIKNLNVDKSGYKNSPPKGESNSPKNKSHLKYYNEELLSNDTFPLNIDNTVLNMVDGIPQSIVGTYVDDYNIIEVHKVLIKRFHLLRNKQIRQLNQKKIIEKSKIERVQSIIERKTSLSNIEKIDLELQSLSNLVEYNEYMNKVKDLIESYYRLCSTPKVVSFGTSSIKDTLTDEELSKIQQRIQIINKYLRITQRYMRIDVIQEIINSPQDICTGCGNVLPELVVDYTQNIQSCPICSIERVIITQTAFYKDTSRINTSSRNNYDDRDNFWKAVLRFKGSRPNNLQQKTLDNMFSNLNSYFKGYNLPTSEQIKNKPLDHRGRREGTDKEMMYKALSNIGYAAYYENINLICHLYWGWELPDISQIEDIIMEDYDKSQRVFEKVKKDRKSSLNGQYRLFKILERHNFKCRSDDFKIVKTDEILGYHEEMWEMICKELGWVFVKTEL